MTTFEAPFRIVIFKHERSHDDSGCGVVDAALRARGWREAMDVGNGMYTFRGLVENQLESARGAAEQCGAEYRIFDAKDRELRRDQGWRDPSSWGRAEKDRNGSAAPVE